MDFMYFLITSQLILIHKKRLYHRPGEKWAIGNQRGHVCIFEAKLWTQQMNFLIHREHMIYDKFTFVQIFRAQAISVCLILYISSTIFQLCRGRSSWVEPVLS